MSLKSGKYQKIDEYSVPSGYGISGDAGPDGTYRIQKKLWDGTNVQVSQRVGDGEREWVSALLAVMYVRGYLTEDEFGARNDAALKAVTRPDLNRLVADLPEEEDDWRKVRKVKPDHQDLAEVAAPKKAVLRILPFLVLGVAAVLTGLLALDSPATAASQTVCRAFLIFIGFVSLWAGSRFTRNN